MMSLAWKTERNRRKSIQASPSSSFSSPSPLLVAICVVEAAALPRHFLSSLWHVTRGRGSGGQTGTRNFFSWAKTEDTHLEGDFWGDVLGQSGSGEGGGGAEMGEIGV